MDAAQLVDKVFGRLTVIGEAPSRGYARYVRVACSCGEFREVRVHALKTAQSCGCLRAEKLSVATAERNKTHGLSGTPTYAIWKGMRQRTSDPKTVGWEQYQHVKVCERWNSYANFLADMGERPEGLTLERKDNTLGYSAENCVWATPKEQARNRSSNKLVYYKGEVKPLVVWVEQLGLNYDLTKLRLKRGWAPERAFETSRGEHGTNGRTTAGDSSCGGVA